VHRLVGQRLIESAEPTPQASLNHENPSSLEVGARHYVTMASPPPELQQIASPGRVYRIAAMLLGVGTLHFVTPKPFDTVVPAELPGSARIYTYASGVAEVVTGAALLYPKTRRRAALAAMALFVAVFPANVNMVRLWKDRPLFMRLGAIARLPLQIPMIVEAFRIYRTS
jgi:uncharacterized membrane protein